MSRSSAPVVLDACVLLPMPLADTLLRLAETPSLFLPKWSDETILEVTRNLLGKWGKTPAQAARRASVMRQHFPEALVKIPDDLVSAMLNDRGDRHVLAAAVQSGAKLIVTYNAKHFPPASTEPYGIECLGPSTFLISLYKLQPGIVSARLSEQAQAVGISMTGLLIRLRVNVPAFVTFFCEEQKIELEPIE